MFAISKIINICVMCNSKMKKIEDKKYPWLTLKTISKYKKIAEFCYVITMLGL